jgi:hypothetical protein
MRGTICLVAGAMLLFVASVAQADPIYNNLTPTDAIAAASRPDGAGVFEIETADDFILSGATTINAASFIGLVVPGVNGGSVTVTSVGVEIYRVFPQDSDVGRTSGAPVFSTPEVPTRVNSPSDIALTERSSETAGQLSFTTTALANSFTTVNSIQPGGIHPKPNQTTGGNGPLTGQEVQFDVTFTAPIDLAADHYFFVPVVSLSNGAQFYWLSASRPISSAGSTPFLPDLQAWTRDQFLDPDWLRIGTDIVGGSTPPTFNMAFSLDGVPKKDVPEPVTTAMLVAGVSGLALRARRRSRWRERIGRQ